MARGTHGNHEVTRRARASSAGLGIYDVSRLTPQSSSPNGRRPGGENGYDFDGRYAYISPTASGLCRQHRDDPRSRRSRHPEEVGRWWIPGQWQAGRAYPGTIRVAALPSSDPAGDRLYVSYWHHGFFILDIADMARPKVIAALNSSPSFPHPTHTCLPLPQPLKGGRRIMVVADEDVAKLRPAPPSFAWIYDITDETTPLPIATFQVPGLDPTARRSRR